MGCGLWDAVFGVLGVERAAQAHGSLVLSLKGSGIEIWSLGFGVQVLGFRVRGSGLAVQCSGFRLQGFRTLGFGGRARCTRSWLPGPPLDAFCV